MPGGRNKRGGYREPATPATVSGPRGMSRRTDGGPADRRQPVRAIPAGQHGDRQATVTQQQAAPLASSEPVSALDVVTRAAQGYDFQPLPPFERGTEFPDEPLTAGLSTGEGPGPEAIGMLPNVGRSIDPDIAAMAPYLPALEQMANQPNASVATRNFVRRLRGAVPPEAVV